MKFILLIVASQLLMSCNSSIKEGHSQNSPLPETTISPKVSARLLISGHSLTDNPLANYLESIAAHENLDFNYNQQIGLGSPIRVRTRGMDGNASGWDGYSTGKNKFGSNLNILNELVNPQTLGPGEKYDSLILTENHNFLEMLQWENTLYYAKHFHDQFISGNSEAQTWLYHPWLSIDKNAPANWIDHEKKALEGWECVARKLNLELEAQNRNDRIKVLPSGGALVALVEKAIANEIPGITGSTVNKLDLIFSDNVHTTNLGMYYIALVSHSVIFGASPEGTYVPNGISSQTASALQTLAWEYVSDYYADAGNQTRTMSSCRNALVRTGGICESYWTLKNDLARIPSCKSYFGGLSSPFY